MIIDLSSGYRSLKSTEPLEKIGYLKKKDDLIKRHFTKLSVIFVISGNGWLEQNGKMIVLQAPFCMINDVGEQKIYGPNDTWDEFFFGYHPKAEKRIHSIWNQELFEAKIWPIRDINEFMEYLNIVLSLMKQPLLQKHYDQLDHLAVCLLSASFSHPRIKSLSPKVRKLIEIESWLTNNYNKDIDIKALASDFGFSYPNFRRLWKTRYSTSPYQQILKKRNVEACNLLSKSYLPISDIANQVGFNNQHYFARFFKQMNSITPSEYRRNNSILNIK